MKKSFLVMAAVFVSALVINSNPLMAQTKTDQELAKENLEFRRQNAELRDRLRRLEARNRIAASGNANQSQQQPSMSSEAAAARAADLPTKAPPPAPPPIPAHTWTGFMWVGTSAVPGATVTSPMCWIRLASMFLILRRNRLHSEHQA